MTRSGWHEVKFIGGRLDGKVRMVIIDPAGLLAEEIRIAIPAGRHEVYTLHADELTADRARWVYRNPRYELQE